MLSIKVILLLLAFVMVLLQGFNVQAPRVTLGWLGLALWLLSLLIA